MKQTINKLGIVAILLSSSTVISACSQQSLEAGKSKPSASATNIQMTKGPNNKKEIESFADPLFEEKMKEYNVNGSSFVVVHDGKVVVNKGYGYADKEKKIPVTKDTVFQIGSVSKTFTALAVMQQVDKGKLKLDQDVQKYLGGLQIPNQTGKPLTLFDMLTYTSGVDFPDLTNITGPEYINDGILMKEFFSKHMPTVVRPPGEVYTYDNVSFALAGFAVENVTNTPFSKYMEKNIFKPLDMKSTSMSFTPDLLERMATHYGPTGDPIPTSGSGLRDTPQGGILSTAEDMSKYMIMQLQKGKFKDKEIVSKKSMDMMHDYQVFDDKTTPVATIGFETPFNKFANGQHVVIKGGSMPGHQSMLILVPEQKTAFFMSYNNDSMMSIDIYETLMDHYFPAKKNEVKTSYLPLEEKEAHKYLGLFQNTRFAAIRTHFSYENGNLIMEDGTTGKQVLKMIHPLLFEDSEGNKVAFKKNSAGEIAYFHYNSPKSLDFVADAQRINNKPPFDDVPQKSNYRSHIDNLHTLNIMGSKKENLFDPMGTMTQGEFADSLLLAYGWNGFPDDSKEAREKIMNGIPGYDRATLITRQVAATMIQNLRKIHDLKPIQPDKAIKVKLFDVADDWAVQSIQALASQGILDPDTSINADGSFIFRPKDLLLRQEASALLDLAFNYYALPIKRQ
ncbi:beta-lactamase family protein (plasmid) [Priestia megaterium]|jgi:CubicO group peptidase (beta-lactamase class C family)|uniref:serine hydrolase n=1 Tax=Priestia megaterium TaxID=1404 RepID=UPI000BF6E222|nr:serine hydrolase [Priestia megaterium]MDP9580398.1 CubicO group peptidase (beta-lactamase class C family) [Bacillus sp. 1751]MDH2449337.1 beta-lactamase family protein [Priestia megaterium]MDL5148795.1 beta-lactamase family protein [Priestia megaterium]MED4030353.1 beta-lactamase family protein [Priestia megaterium]PER66665.1 penicillin-binding protein [Priestia megaterium]